MLLDSKKILNNFVGNNSVSSHLINTFNNSAHSGVWILRGSKGIGKAKLAENIIKELFKLNKTNTNLIHPDIFILKKNNVEKKYIPVEDVRKVSSFLSKSSMSGLHRSVLIDSISEMNNFGHNALLKILEEHLLDVSFLIALSSFLIPV